MAYPVETMLTKSFKEVTVNENRQNETLNANVGITGFNGQFELNAWLTGKTNKPYFFITGSSVKDVKIQLEHSVKQVYVTRSSDNEKVILEAFGSLLGEFMSQFEVSF